MPEECFLGRPWGADIINSSEHQAIIKLIVACLSEALSVTLALRVGVLPTMWPPTFPILYNGACGVSAAQEWVCLQHRGKARPE